jgi:hypothetical protein
MFEVAAARGGISTATNQLFILNLSERRGTARLMGAWEIHAQSQGFERDEGLRNNGRRRSKNDDMSNRTGGRSTAERAVLEMGVRSRMVVPVVCGHLRLVSGGTRLEQERRTARRHETDRHIGTKQEDYQQQAGK